MTSTVSEATEFSHLTSQVRAAGLFGRRRGYYGLKTALTVGAFVAAWLAVIRLGDSWATLGVAALLGLLSTQLGFLSHDAGHRQIFASGRPNRIFGLVIGNGLIGLSFGWWVPKHNAHHANPNHIGLDPDIGLGYRPPSEDSEAGRPTRVSEWMDRWQGVAFLLLMLLRSTGLYVSGAVDLLRRKNRRAAVEGAVILLHMLLYFGVIFWTLGPLTAIAFIAVHQAVFSIYLGFSFAPNHKGMPVLRDGTRLSFAERQILTARNVIGGRLLTFALGGLNYQIEHHLFPSVPRPNLIRAQSLVRGYCADNGFNYCEENLFDSYRRAIFGVHAAPLSNEAS